MGRGFYLLAVLSSLLVACGHQPKSRSAISTRKIAKVEYYQPISKRGEIGLNCKALEVAPSESEKFHLTSPERFIQYTDQLKFPLKLGEDKISYCDRFLRKFKIAEGRDFRRVKVTRFL